MKQNNTQTTFVTLINNSLVHRVDLTSAGQKNTRDYAYGIAHYSVGDSFKAEVNFADKTEAVIKNIVIKNKTFNTIVATFDSAESISPIMHALSSREMMTRMLTAKSMQTKAELDKLALAHQYQ